MRHSKIINFNRFFVGVIIVFVLALSVTVYFRGGKDLKVDIYGAQQTLNKESPYKNPAGDHDLRPLFRYAPGFAIMVYPFILKSEPYQVIKSDLKIGNITPSVFAWFFFKIILLLLSAKILLEFIPAVSREVAQRNLKISFLLSLPLIGCELANGQNKIIALFFMLLAFWLFERKKLFTCALCFCLALTVYIPLGIFALYFVIRNKKFIFSLVPAAFIVFLFIPSLVFGVNYNLYLLKEWFMATIKPFCLTDSYVSYTDLRVSSQSLPSAVGRIFVSGHTDNFKYLISSLAVHAIIRVMAFIMVLISCVAVWRRRSRPSEGLCYIIFFILAMLLPQYCITYMWSWAFVFYFIIFNYTSYPEISPRLKKFMLLLTSVFLVTTISIVFKVLNRCSVLFWGTVFLWAGLVGILIKNIQMLPADD